MSNILFKNRDLLESCLLPFLLYREQQLIFANKFLSKLNYDLKCKHYGLHGTIETYDRNTRKLESSCEYSDNVKNGLEKTYEKGKLYIEYHYVNGIKNGLRKSYFNGKLHTECYYVNDMIEGIFLVSLNDCIVTRQTYAKDKLNGDYKEFHQNGVMRVHGNYINDNRNGQWKYWYPNGELEASDGYVNGIMNCEYKSFNYAGKITAHYYYINGKRTHSMCLYLAYKFLQKLKVKLHITN